MKKFLCAALALVTALSLAVMPADALTVDQARDLLDQFYVDPIPQEILHLDSVDEILSALGDPYTVYMSESQYQAFLDFVNGDVVVGIGVSLETAFEDGYRILSVLADSPALAAGIEPGDRVVAVNGVTLTPGMDVQAAMAGEEGTEVTVTLVRRATGLRQDLTMKRSTVPIPIVTYDQLGNVGYIDCTSFGDTTVETMENALRELDASVDVWLLDLRSNPGGTVAAATGASGLFVGGNLTMIYLRDASGHYQYHYTTAICPDLTDKPLLVLTSEFSASGAEMFAGDARDYGFGIGIGQRTFGKGTAQTVLEQGNVPDVFHGDALKVTTDRFFSASGTTNHVVGVLPTLLISADNTTQAAMLLTAPAPDSPTGHVRLTLGSFTFYIDLRQATREENLAAFTELLEAIPPAVKLTWGTERTWEDCPQLTAQDLAARLGLPYRSRCPFPDLEGVPQADKIRTLAVYGLLSGTDEGTFQPDAPVTRAQFCQMLANAMDMPASEGGTPFSDVSPDAWYAGAVSAMYSRGFISGCGDGTFRPDAPVTGQEAVRVLASAAAWLSMDGFELAGEEMPEGERSIYAIYSPWAQPYARILTHMGMKIGLDHPAENASRAVSAGLIYDLMEVTGLFWGDF